MSKPFDVRPVAAALYFLPVRTRVPLKFGREVLSEVTCARVRLTVEDREGRRADGWGETPLSVQWVWPSSESYEARHEVLKQFCVHLAGLWAHGGREELCGHAIEVGHLFNEVYLEANRVSHASDTPAGPMPHLAALVCNSAFDIALHDAYGKLHGVPTYQTYNARYMNDDLSRFLEPADLEAAVTFEGLYPEDFLVQTPPTVLPAWHLVGGVDPVSTSELTGNEPDDGEPVLLRDWIRRDGLNVPQNQAPRQRPELGLATARRDRHDVRRGGGGLADDRL